MQAAPCALLATVGAASSGQTIVFLVAALGYLAILADATSATPAVTVVALVLQTIPIAFLTRRSVGSTFR